MRKLLYLVLCVSVLAALGCAITNYPVITDDRGGYSGVIRTGHKALIVPTGQIASIYSDGSDNIFSMVYQNQYADQKLYSFNNYDPTASVMFFDNDYCDWRYDGCEVIRAWNPHDHHLDDPFDYEMFPDCSGYRSLSFLVNYTYRLGECGDGFRFQDTQDLAAEFAQLSTTTFRGEAAYVFSINAANTSITISANGIDASMPMFGQQTGVIDNDLNVIFPMTPNVRHGMRWLTNFAAQNGNVVTAAVSYGSLEGSLQLSLQTDAMNYNLNRF